MGGARRLYGTDGESRDLAASEFRLVAPDSVQLNSAPERVDRCPGEIHRVKWSVANLGTRDETYNVRWYLSTNRTITEFDRAIGTNINAVQVTGAFSTWERTVRIPWDMEPGEYFVGHLVDYDQRIWERRGSNNYTYMATRIRVLPSDDRRCQR